MTAMRALAIVVASLLVPVVAVAQPAPAPAEPSAPAPDPNGGMVGAPPTGAPVGGAMLVPAPTRERHGLFGGVGLYGGNISCNGEACGNFSKAGGGMFQIGWMFTPKLGLLVDTWAMTASNENENQNDVKLTFVTSTLNVRYYLLPALWVQAGAGNGHASVHISIFSSRSDDVPVGQFAAGFELVRGGQWAIDVAFRVAQGTSTKAGSMSSDDATTGRSTGIGANFTYFAMR